MVAVSAAKIMFMFVYTTQIFRDYDDNRKNYNVRSIGRFGGCMLASSGINRNAQKGDK